jgi:hypothetical protein
MNAAVKKIAADLNANKGAALVVCGSNDANPNNSQCHQ